MSHMSRDEYVAWVKSPERLEEIRALTVAEVVDRLDSEFNRLSRVRLQKSYEVDYESIRKIDEALATVRGIRARADRLVEDLTYQWGINHFAGWKEASSETHGPAET